MLILLLFAFIAGFVTILAPCIWPLLPIILSVSSGSGRLRPLGITLGIITSFTIFTLSISYLEKAFHINPNALRTIAVIALVFLGISMLFPSFATRFEDLINFLLRPLRGRIKTKGTGFGAGYAMGFATGLVWAPCSGPILATIATLAATQSVNIKAVAVTIAYVAGLGIPLFLFSLAGNQFFNLMRSFTKYTLRIQQAFGIVVIISAILIYTNYDKAIQLKILRIFPSYGNIFTRLETNKEVTRELKMLRGEKRGLKEMKIAKGTLPDLGPAPEFKGIFKWLNTEQPLTMEALKGKVVLVDFWTYTCINCVRELPHVVNWYDKYKDYNFVIIGVHTPEFAFEKETKNVQNAIRQFKIHYPVAQDNDYQTWRAFDNSYWPAIYLIDTNGHIRKTHFGEGEYEETEEAIRELLQESGNIVQAPVSSIKDRTPQYRITPETYLGRARMEYRDGLAFKGGWDISQESAKAQKGAALEINFNADKVFLVISPHAKDDRIKLLIDGRPISDAIAGSDVKDGQLILDTQRLYNLIDLKGKIESHLLRLEFQNDGISVYAFTFG